MKTIVILFLLIAYSSIYSQDTNGVKFFPLKIGNSWTYSYQSGMQNYRFKSQVLRDTLIQGHKYYYISNAIQFEWVSWVRVDSAKGNLIGFYINSCNGSNFKIIDSLSASSNDTVRACPSSPFDFRKCSGVSPELRWGLNTTKKSFNWTQGPGGKLRDYSKQFGLIWAGYGEISPTIVSILGCVLNGVVYGDTALTGISQISNEIPETFSLSQNYPNPFNPVTNIKFDLPKSGLVKLTIYDLLGREITALVNQQMQAGSYSADWDASSYPSGVYLYKLVVGDNTNNGGFVETKKMVLVK